MDRVKYSQSDIYMFITIPDTNPATTDAATNSATISNFGADPATTAYING
jgi:hypothetical protein